ncbi:MAG: spore coat protein U domain-containing protein [Pseudomonadota bacterium]
MKATHCFVAALLLGVAGAASAAPQCMVGSGAQLAFGTVVALASSPDATSDTGAGFWVNCNAEVASAPLLYSDTSRTMGSAGGNLPFTLSLAAPGGLQLPTASPGTALAIVRNGTNQTVTLYGKIRSVDFRALPAGVYSTTVTLTLEY